MADQNLGSFNFFYFFWLHQHFDREINKNVGRISLLMKGKRDCLMFIFFLKAIKRMSLIIGIDLINLIAAVHCYIEATKAKRQIRNLFHVYILVSLTF